MTLKRATDIVLGSFLALAALPVIALLALGCGFALGAWPFFVQRRAGRHGREFSLPKLRTLAPSVPRDATKYDLDEAAIPPFCRFLRRTHLDELPQLLVVPFGRMSLVGPRPEMPSLLARYPKSLLHARSRLRPGCTGLWQVSNCSGMLIHESPEYDLAYVEHCNIWLDLWILYRTAVLAVTGRSDVDLAAVPEWAWKGARRLVPVDAGGQVIDLPLLERIERLERAELDVDLTLEERLPVALEAEG